MKRIYLLVIAVCACYYTSQAQAPEVEGEIRERIHVSTDKENYVAGELVWMKLISTDGEGVPLSFSRVGYVELANEEQSDIRTRIELIGGIGEGSMLLPATLPTGYYRLVGYTRWMWNGGKEIFFDKRIGVVNPGMAEVYSDVAEDATESTQASPTTVSVSVSPTSNNLSVSSDNSTYQPRSEVHLDISDIPADIHTLSVSVTAADALGDFAAPSLESWKRGLPTGPQPFSGEYEAEYEGAIVTGHLVSTETGETTYSPDVLPLAAFPGERIDLFGGSLDETGRVVFRTTRATGFDEIATTMRENGDKPLHIDIDAPFFGGDLTGSIPSFPLADIDETSMLQQSLAMQLQYSYISDSLLRRSVASTHFSERPNYSYDLDEWRRFATMDEVITEFVALTRFKPVDGKHQLEVTNEELIASGHQGDLLVLIDGIPIFDHEIVYNYNPLHVSRIDIYNDRYMFGGNIFYGIVAFYTTDNRYPDLQPDPFTQISSYDSPQARRLFYSPDYTDPSILASRIPDYRHTLYWNANVKSENGVAGVNFFTSDLRGKYQVLVEGITTSGEAVSAVYPIEVK
jgi:hypothetical protein